MSNRKQFSSEQAEAAICSLPFCLRSIEAVSDAPAEFRGIALWTRVGHYRILALIDDQGDLKAFLEVLDRLGRPTVIMRNMGRKQLDVPDWISVNEIKDDKIARQQLSRLSCCAFNDEDQQARPQAHESVVTFMLGDEFATIKTNRRRRFDRAMMIIAAWNASVNVRVVLAKDTTVRVPGWLNPVDCLNFSEDDFLQRFSFCGRAKQIVCRGAPRFHLFFILNGTVYHAETNEVHKLLGLVLELQRMGYRRTCWGCTNGNLIDLTVIGGYVKWSDKLIETDVPECIPG